MDALDMLGGIGNTAKKLKQIWIRKYEKAQAENTKNVHQNSWKITEILLKILPEGDLGVPNWQNCVQEAP